jgi:HEAT repeat protein
MSEFEDQDERNALIIKAVTRKLQATPDKSKRIKILKAIGKLQAPWIPQALVEALADTSEDVREQIESMLAERESLDLRILYQKLVKSPWFVKSAALKVLAKKKDPASVKEIERILGDKNVDVLRNATVALGEIGGHESRRLLVGLAKINNPYVRTAAEEALRKATEVKFC